MLLEPIYEHDFRDCSYGFRPGRSAHQALEAVWQQAMNHPVGWVLEVDIRKFFDKLDHAHLREFLRLRIKDGVLLRLIDKWLKAGVMEDEQVFYPEAGSPQGGVISPLLANIFLHYVLDVWFAEEVLPRLQGYAAMIRYADDFVILFRHEADARRVMEVLPKRFERFGLTLHPDKTRLVPFRRPPQAASGDPSRSAPEPGTFDLLGFTHYWGRSRTGRWVVKRKTASNRLTRAVRGIAEWCAKHRHRPITEQQRALSQKLRGHYAYYGITGNGSSLAAFYLAAKRAWRQWLSRRNRERHFPWSIFAAMLQRTPLPLPRVVHSVYHHRQPAT
jgi:group II intron reverse transcriptase/maturase